MSDPAVEAAQRAWAERYPGGSVDLAASAYDDGVGALAIAVAREALKPIRDLIEQLEDEGSPVNCWDGVYWVLDDLKPLVYGADDG